MLFEESLSRIEVIREVGTSVGYVPIPPPVRTLVIPRSAGSLDVAVEARLAGRRGSGRGVLRPTSDAPKFIRQSGRTESSTWPTSRWRPSLDLDDRGPTRF